MSPVRILYLIARLNIGGPAIHVILLTEGLKGEGFETHLVSGVEGPNEGNMLDLAAAKGVTPLIVPELGREIDLRSDARALGELYGIIRRVRPHIVHTHTAKAGFLGRIAARLAGVPIVLHTFHGHIFRGYFGSLQSQLFLGLERFLARLSDRVVTLSPRLRDELVAYGIARPEHIAVIPLGFELESLLSTGSVRGRFRSELGILDSTPLIGIVGRLVPIKNHRLFLDVAQRVLQEMPQAKIVVVGDGESRIDLEAYSRRLGIDPQVIFTGWRRDLPTIYADLNVLALSSNNEGTPVSIIEAMAAGVPVVATRVGGVPDLVREGETGFLVEAGDERAMVTAVLELLRNPERAQQMGQRGRHLAQDNHTVQKLVERTRSLYLELLRAKGFST